MTPSTAIIWFRRDLRIYDNAALNWALEHCERVIPVYIHAPEEDAPWVPGAASRWWLHHSLRALQDQLARFDLQLQFFSGNSLQLLRQIATDSQATYLVYNALYEPAAAQRDQQLTQQLQGKLEVRSFQGNLLFKPGSILNNQGLPYRVYTPFYKKCHSLLGEFARYRVKDIQPLLRQVKNVTTSNALQLDSLCLLDDHPWHQKLSRYWQPGEDYAHQQLEHFLNSPVGDYANQRNLPAIDGTSRLSASLHFGEITPQQILLSIQPLLIEEDSVRFQESYQTYIKQILWREFAQHILWHFPHTDTQSMDTRYKDNFWHHDTALLNQWKHAQTGVPIIDAGMKQLWETGWMHNRVRMIVSSFLTKNLGVHWIEGARWFWDTLIDADLANNSMGWQWVAGCGVDAQPYYRVFNPLTQAERFDSQNRYINNWNQGQDTAPMIDLKQSREDALERYKQYIQLKN